MGVMAIIGMGNEFKVVDVIVELVSVFVVRLKTFWYSAKKRFHDKDVDIGLIFFAIPGKRYSGIISSFFLWRNKAFWLSHRSPIIFPCCDSTNSPMVTDLVNTFVSGNCKPIFHRRSLPWHTT